METSDQRVAIVTGGSRGIGRAIALRLARDGYAVVIGYREREEAADAVVGELRGAGHVAKAVRCDVARVADIQELFQVADQVGRLGVVVLNAAATPLGPVTAITDADVDLALDVNLRSAVVAFREAAGRLGVGGRVVVLSTDLTRSPIAASSIYSASKVAVEALVRSFAHEMGPRGVTVNAVQPGITDTEGLILPEPAVAAIVARTPLGRTGRPEDIADVVGFLASDDARWITGQAICVNGGMA